MKNSRPGVIFKIAIAAIILISITIVALIIMLTTIDSENPYVINEDVATETVVTSEKTSNTYLDKMENYKDVARDERPGVNVEDEDTASLVSQTSEESKNSAGTLIDAIVAKSLEKKPEPVVAPETVVAPEPVVAPAQ